MDAQHSHHGQAIEINVDVRERTDVQNKICGEVPCGLKDAGTTSKEARERAASMRKLWIVVALCAIFMAIEIAGGIMANSLAILTDAAHLLSDVASFAISLFSLWAAGWEATPRQSYGFFRVEILGALVSIQIIWLITGILVYEAIVRMINETRQFNETEQVNGFIMFVVASFGLVVNLIMACLLGHDHGHGHGHDHSHNHGHDDHSHGIGDNQAITITTHHHHHGGHSTEEHHNHGDHAHKDHDHSQPLLDQSKTEGQQKKRLNINIQGAYLHVLGDSIQSIGVIIAGAFIWYHPEWKIVDLICTLVFSVIVLYTTIKMLRNILEVLMESTPREIDATKLEKGLLEMEEVVAIHELHIWAITVGKVLLACHVKVTPEANADLVLNNVIEYIKREYNISHVTIQIEH